MILARTQAEEEGVWRMGDRLWLTMRNLFWHRGLREPRCGSSKGGNQGERAVVEDRSAEPLFHHRRSSAKSVNNRQSPSDFVVL